MDGIEEEWRLMVLFTGQVEKSVPVGSSWLNASLLSHLAPLSESSRTRLSLMSQARLQGLVAQSNPA